MGILFLVAQIACIQILTNECGIFVLIIEIPENLLKSLKRLLLFVHSLTHSSGFKPGAMGGSCIFKNGFNHFLSSIESVLLVSVFLFALHSPS
jgi:hypothetical protein